MVRGRFLSVKDQFLNPTRGHSACLSGREAGMIDRAVEPGATLALPNRQRSVPGLSLHSREKCPAQASASKTANMRG